MARNDFSGPAKRRGVVELNRLRQLNNGMVGKMVEYGLAESLKRWPNVAEIPPAMKQDRPVGHCIGKRFPIDIMLTDIARFTLPVASQIGYLASPDRQISHVWMIGEVQQGIRRVV